MSVLFEDTNWLASKYSFVTIIDQSHSEKSLFQNICVFIKDTRYSKAVVLLYGCNILE